MERREALRHLGSTLLLGAMSSILPVAASAARPKRAPAALLAPLTGPHAALGVTMERAAALVQAADSKDGDLIVLDTNSLGPAEAARQAIKRGARIILGPLLAGEVRPVVEAASGRAPVLSFSNDPALRESGAFLIGVTPAQATSAILQYARRRGIRTVGIQPDTDSWAREAIATAERLQGELGITLTMLPAGPLPAALSGKEEPMALLVPSGGEALIAAASALKGSGIQLLGTLQGVDHSPAALAVLEGAWFAAPDPAAFGKFARDYQARHGGSPGAIAALAYDAAMIVRTLQRRNQLDRAGLLAAESFPGVTGALRFRSDGSCARELAILVAGAEGYSVVDRSLAA